MLYMDTTVVAGIRGFLFVLALASLTACVKDDSTSAVVTPPNAAQPGDPDPVDPAPEQPIEPPSGSLNAAPQIAGAPASEVTVGKAFDFAPNATDADDDELTFSISSKPSWASFDRDTGRLWGTPDAGDVGSHEEIVITVSDGTTTRALPQFAIDVIEPASANVTLAWQPPTENTDGSTLTNLKGYKIHYGPESGRYDKTITIDNAGLTRYVVEDLEPGTYFFAVSAISQTGSESKTSGEASATI
jgi:hypothetical protein